jgi:hypothetical protein
MSIKFHARLFSSLCICLLWFTLFTNNIVSAKSKVKFICRMTRENVWTTMAFYQNQERALIIWDSKLSPSYPPQKRCQDVTPRFQQAVENYFMFFTNGILNKQPVICTVKKYGDKCDDNNLVMTLLLTEDSSNVLTELVQRLKGWQYGPIKHSGGSPQIYYQIDIESLLRLKTEN